MIPLKQKKPEFLASNQERVALHLTRDVDHALSTLQPLQMGSVAGKVRDFQVVYWIGRTEALPRCDIGL